ncbi:hypothetical protein D1007_32815 [Hordeum vulgare]|nr:hypothetical protein D1007_32815 [Hordeum vulgare]
MRRGVLGWLPVLPVPAAARSQVHPLGERDPSRPEAEQPAAERQLRPQDLRLRPGAAVVGERHDDGVRGHAVVPGPGAAAQLYRLLRRHRRLVGRLHLHGAHQPRTALPGEGPHAPDAAHHGGDRHPHRRRPGLHPERGRQEIHEAPAAVPSPAVPGPVPQGAASRARPHRADAHLQPASEDHS